MRNKKPDNIDINSNDENPSNEKKTWRDSFLFDLIKNGYNLYDISKEYDVTFSYLFDLVKQNEEEYNIALTYYYKFLGELMETKTRNATTSIVTSYISLLKILKPEKYKNDDIDELGDIQFELQG